MTAKPYFTVAVREDASSPWGIHFGDYDREIAREEAFEATQCGYRRTDVKLISSADDQASIDRAIAQLNGEG